MNELQIFSNEEFGEVRSIVIDDEPWFVGKDVAKALGYTDLNHSILDHVDEEDRVNSKTQGQNNPEFGQRGTWLINESGIYALVFGSKLPTSKKFKHWVTSELLPTLRKTGSYSMKQAATPNELILMLAQQNVETDKRLAAVESKISVISDYAGKLEKLEERLGKAHDVDAVTASKIARDLGFFSESGNPHAELITAVARLCKINVTRNSFFDNEYSQAVIENVNGAAIPVVYFKPPAQEKIYDWLEANLNDSYDYSKYRIKCRGHKPGDIREEWFEINNKHYKVYNEDGKQITEVDWTDDYTGNLMDEYE